MNTHSGPFPTAPTSVMRNTTPSRRRDLRRRLGPRNVCSVSGIPEARHGRSKSPRKKGPKRKMVFKRMEKEIPKAVTRAPAQEEHNLFQREMIAKEGPHAGQKHCPKGKTVKKGIGSQDKKGRSLSIEEDDLSQPWVCEETNAFTPRIRYFDFPKTQMPSHVKTYDGSEDLEDHLKIFQAAAKTKRWAMPTWCHMFNFTLTKNKKCIKDPVKNRNIKQRDGESTEEFVRRYKLECRDVNGDPGCMKISGFMHGITSTELIKRLHDKIPKSADKMMRVTTTFLRGRNGIQANEKSIAKIPMLTAPKEKEELIIYLAAAKEAISAVLMTKIDGKQTTVYFVSRALQGLKINYAPIEKLILALMTPRIQKMENEEELSDPWILFTDGSSCMDSSEAVLILTSPEGVKFTYALRFTFEASNNEAEYEALIASLRIAEKMGVKSLQAHVVANQVNGSYIAKEPGMIRYLEKVRAFTSNFMEFSIKQVPIGENKKADALRKIASSSFAHLSKPVLVEELKENSIDKKEVLAVVEEGGRTWMTPIYEYLTEEILPREKKKARAIRRKAGPGKVKFLIVAIDYFIKWIEAKPVATITGAQIKKFVWDNIVCRFGLLGEIVSDNEKQFRDNLFKDWYEKLCICNALLPLNIRNLTAHRTMIKSSNEETRFSLTYRTKEIIPIEIGMPNWRNAELDMIKNDEALKINLDLLEEKIEQAAIQEAKKQSQNREIL
nr:reverse transcriptase domain-containing protein [Tanacetum cinerariifolium]